MAFIAVLATLPYLPPMERKGTILQSFLYIDWIGTLLSVLTVTFLLIAVQWGGNTRPWSDGLVIAFLVLVCLIYFR